MSNKPYQIVFGEIRKQAEGKKSFDWKLILHDHGGATCTDCIENTLNELNTLAYDKRKAEEALKVMADEIVGLREAQRLLCKRCDTKGLGKRGNNYKNRIAVDSNLTARNALLEAMKRRKK